jgi:cell division transport system ATP-binding protein
MQISFEGVSKRYPGGRDALREVNFRIDPGEMVFLTGRSGAGKSTVLKLIALLERPSAGVVMVNGRGTYTVRGRHVAAFRRQLGVVFQDHKLLPDRTVFDNVALPLIVSGGFSSRTINFKVRGALEDVGLEGKEALRPLDLSAGEQQRVGIARAVVAEPGLLIADEPTGNLDPASAVEVMRLFRSFQESGVTVVVATHDPHLIKEFGHREIMLDRGRTRGGGLAETLPSFMAAR